MSYSFAMKTVSDIGNPNVKYNYAVITTEIENVKPEIIKKQMKSTPYIGINGGFFEGSYTSPPTTLKAISYWKDDTAKYEYNGTKSSQVARKTFVSYFSGGKYQASYHNVKNLTEALGKHSSVRAVIGGMDYSLDSWGTKAYYLITNRTVLAWDNAKGKAYMIVTHDRNVNIPVLKNHMTEMGFNPSNSIILDGSCSSLMRVPVNNQVKFYGCDTEHRYIGNMVRVYGDTFA